MSIKIDTEEKFNDFDVKDYIVPAKPKELDVRGYMYIIVDSKFPDHIKIGKTLDMGKRLLGYNSDKPYPTTSLVMISKLFEDVSTVEKKILEQMYKEAQPTTAKKEWFEVEHKQLMIELIDEAEEYFTTL